MGPGKWMNEWMINKAEKVDGETNREAEAIQATTEPPKGFGMGIT